MNEPMNITRVKGLGLMLESGIESEYAVALPDRTILLAARSIKEAREEAAAVFGLKPYDFDIIP